MHPDLEIVQRRGQPRGRGASTTLWGIPRGESSFVTADHPRGVQPAVARPGDPPPHRVRAEDPAARRARRRDQRRRRCSRRRRPSGDRRRARRLPGARLRRARGDAAGGPLRRHARPRGHARGLLRLRRGGRRAHARRSGRAAPMRLPLEIEEAHYRDLGDPLLRYLRGITADEGTVAVVVMPELIFSGPQRLLHNQRALYIKRLLLFEPRVILTAVPYRLQLQLTDTNRAGASLNQHARPRSDRRRRGLSRPSRSRLRQRRPGRPGLRQRQVPARVADVLVLQALRGDDPVLPLVPRPTRRTRSSSKTNDPANELPRIDGYVHTRAAGCRATAT